MININGQIATIENATRGEEVRDAIIRAFELINTNATTTSDGMMDKTDKQKLNKIPAPTANDAGKLLVVDASGNYALTELQSAEGVGF